MVDLIERQKTIDAIKNIDDHGNFDRANALGLAENAIIILPTANSSCEWCMWCLDSKENFPCNICSRRYADNYLKCEG